MEKRNINQTGQKSIYIEKNEGNIYVGSGYVEDTTSAFCNGSYELLDYTPTIEPAILRDEVGMIQEWIERDVPSEQSSRLALLYGTAGIGKSIVMHDLLERLQSVDEYLVLGLKSDQIEFRDTDELSHKMHLVQPIDVVVKEMAKKYKRVILLIDQIDALSLSLSSNRTPLRSLLKVVRQIQSVHNVRVVISCRPYDLDFDPLLDNLDINKKWELKELTKEQVLQTLERNRFTERFSGNLLRFLGNPLHLYLFIKVRSCEQLTDPLTTDLLYHQLWRKYVNDDSVRKVNKDKLLSLLDNLVNRMYQRQELSVHVREFETGYDAELKYLFSNGLLIITQNGQVQFFHQTLFDYIYARRFIERDYDLLELLKKQHQGLFIRASVKNILTFLREQNVSEYIRIMDHLLYAKFKDGSYIYRYHIKSLALSNMAYFEIPLQQELNLISKRIYSNKDYMGVIFESIHTVNWFNSIWEIIDGKGGWRKLSNEYRDKIMVMCRRTIASNAEIVLDKLDAVIDYNDEDDRKYLDSIVHFYTLNCRSTKLISLYQKLVTCKNPLKHTQLLENILKENPTFVCEELKDNIKQQLTSNNAKYLGKISINHQVENLYKEILERHHDIGIQLFEDILNIIYDATKIEMNGSKMYSSTEFLSFKRDNSSHIGPDFVEGITNILINVFLANPKSEGNRYHLRKFSQSKHEGIVFIALYVYTSYPNLFKDEIYEIVIHREVLSNAPIWVEYQAIEALRKAFPLMNDAQKKSIISRILAIEDNHEKISRNNYCNRMQHGAPILYIDLHKGKALEVISIVELRRLSWHAYQERQRIDRKFNNAMLKNEKTVSTSAYIGETFLEEAKAKKMNSRAWFNSMLKYNTDNPTNWNSPSMTGQCQLFRAVVKDNPAKFIDFINRIVYDERISLAYTQAGMQGLLDAGRLDDAMCVLNKMLMAINNDVNSTQREFSIHSLLFALNEVVKQTNVPEIIVQLLCNTLINAIEPEDTIDQEKCDIYNVGINQARGNAGYMLIKCARDDRYKEIVFSTIEDIADTASIYTRAAILFNMAVLNHNDKDRNVSLFKKLMHDYHPKLMSMPVHNYNPLVYFVNYALEELIEFFHRATECPECYPQQVIIFWLAWSHNSRDQRAKLMLDKMFDASEDARVSLLKFLRMLDSRINEDAIYYIQRCMEPQFDSETIGQELDYIFHHINDYPENTQNRIINTYLESPSCKHQIRTFIEFLGSYAIKDPIQTLKWLEQILEVNVPEDDFMWNDIIEVVIQAYNGIKSFNDSSNQKVLEHAMDLIDNIMQSPNNNCLISNFIDKLDNE